MALFGVRCQPSRRGQPLGLIPTGCAHAVPEQLPCERSEALLDLRRGPSASDRAIAQDVAKGKADHVRPLWRYVVLAARST